MGIVNCVPLDFGFPAFFVFPRPQSFGFFAIGDMAVAGIAFQDLSGSVGDIRQMTEQGAFSSFVNGGVLLFLAPDGFKEVDHMGGGHITATSELRASFAASRFAFTDQFTSTVKQLVSIPVDVDAALSSVDDCSPSGFAVGAVAVSALAVPLDGFVSIELESCVHGVVHRPSVLRPMIFTRYHNDFIGEVGLQRPSRHIQFVGGIIAGFSRSVFPAVPVPVIIPGIVGIFPSWGRPLKKLPIQPFWGRSFYRMGHLAPGAIIISFGQIGITNGSAMDLVDDFLGMS